MSAHFLLSVLASLFVLIIYLLNFGSSDYQLWTVTCLWIQIVLQVFRSAKHHVIWHASRFRE